MTLYVSLPGTSAGLSPLHYYQGILEYPYYCDVEGFTVLQY